MSWFARHKKLKLAAIFALLTATTVILLLQQPDKLARFKAKLADEGEELSLTKLLPAYSQEAADYQQQMGDVVARLTFSPVAPAEIPIMYKTTNGLARAAWMQPTPSNPRQGTWEDFARQMDSSEAALGELRGLLASPVAGSAFRPAALFTFKAPFDFVSRRRAAQMLAAAVVHELHRGRGAAAMTNLIALLNLARHGDDSDMLVGRMIQVSIAGLAISSTWESLQLPGWTDDQIAVLQSAWQRLELARGFSLTVETERAFAVACYHQYRTNINDRRQIVSLAGGSGGRIADMFYENLYLPLWATAWSKGDELRFLEIMQAAVKNTRQAVTNGNYHLMRSTFAAVMGSFKSNQTTFDNLRFPVGSMLAPNWEKAAIHTLRYETQRQMVFAVLALKRFELRQGRLPADLASLVPEYLPSMPVDYMNGRHLQYRRLSNQRFKLWSVGQDERDENGNGDDLVWFELDRGSTDGAVPKN